MLDNKGFFVIAEFLLAFAGVLIWFSSGFSSAFGIYGFFSRFSAGILCFIISIILHAVGTKER